MRLSGNGRSGSTRGSGAGNVRRCTGWGASPAAIPTCSSCGGRGCGRRVEGRRRMRRESHVRFWEGGGVQVPSATRLVIGCQHEAEARQLLVALKDRLAQFGLSLHESKTRLIEFGRFATERRAAAGQRSPATFDFLRSTHYCGRTRTGRSVVKRKTQAKRMVRKLKAVRQDMLHRMHAPVREQHRWLGQILRGHYRYYGVIFNYRALRVFKDCVVRLWRQVLGKRTWKGRVSWASYKSILTAFPLPEPALHQAWHG